MRNVYIVCSILFFCIPNLGAIDIKLGNSTTEFEIEKTYETQSDGILYLQHNSVCNHLYLEVYLGDTPDNLEKIAEVRWFGTITLAVESGKYWKVAYNMEEYHEFIKDLNIRWTPIIGCNKCD